MTARSLLCTLALVFSGCAPTPLPPLTQVEVQDFVRQYVAAANAADASKMMGLIHRDPAVSSRGTPVQVGRTVTLVDLRGALTIVVKRTPEGLRLIHEHYSVHTP